MLSAEIIAIGSELLTPDKTDTNSLWLTRELNDVGIEVMLKTIVGDDKELSATAYYQDLRQLPPRGLAQKVLVTGKCDAPQPARAIQHLRGSGVASWPSSSAISTSMPRARSPRVICPSTFSSK